jgi:hypothetical protein
MHFAYPSYFKIDLFRMTKRLAFEMFILSYKKPLVFKIQRVEKHSPG